MKKGRNILYSTVVNKWSKDQIKSTLIEIQESCGVYSLVVDRRFVHNAQSFNECVRWAKVAGIINESAQVIEKRNTTPAARSAIKAKPQKSKPFESFGYYNRMAKIR